MYNEMVIVVDKDMATKSFAKFFNDIEFEEHSYLEFDDASSKGKDATSSDSASTKRSHKKRSRDDSENSYSVIYEWLKEVTSALKALNKGIDVNQLFEEVIKVERYDEFMFAFAFDHS
jgi:hypothetical protein